jgi:glycosyltransferase involved in cell wall biosynthesis
MKILMVLTGLGVGGAERQALGVADRFAQSGHLVKIAYLTGPALIRPKSDKVEIVGFQMQKTVGGFIRTVIMLRKLIRSFGPDVVHSHMVHANIFTRIVRLICDMPRLVCTAHSTNEGGKLWMLAYRMTASLADVTTNVSIEAVAAFEMKGAVAPGQMLAIPNGIDVARFQSSEGTRSSIRAREGVLVSEKVVIAVGRLTAAKDYPNLFRAFSDVLQVMPMTRLWIVGDGELRSDLMQEVERLGVANKVSFLGIQNRVEDWMNGSDVFVLSSAWEGFGLVVAEAMACEKVVVATNSGGVKEVLAECGFLVQPRDSGVLSKALIQALSLPLNASQSLGQMGRQRVMAKYSLDAVVQRWLALYDTISVKG